MQVHVWNGGALSPKLNTGEEAEQEEKVEGGGYEQAEVRGMDDRLGRELIVTYIAFVEPLKGSQLSPGF